MKIALDLRTFPDGPTAHLPPLLKALLEPLLRADRENDFVVFCTPANYDLLDVSAPNVRRITLPFRAYFEELGKHLLVEDDVDVLFRSYPLEDQLRFPLDRQIVHIPDLDHETHADRYGPDPLRERRRLFHYFQAGAGALAAGSAETCRELRQDPWTRCADIFSIGPDSADPTEALRAAFQRVAERARRREPAVTVYTPPVVSIVTPSFNQGPFLRRTIESVLRQDYPHIDYRVIDGGSTDETVAVLKSYGPRFPWVSEKDRGQTHAINKGLAQARGQVLAYLNSDDLLRPGAVAKVVEHLRRHPDCDMVYGHGMFIDPEDRYLGMYQTAPYSFANLMNDCCISQPAAFWTRRIAERVGPFDESLKLVMDYDYWLRIDRAGGRIMHRDELLASTRLHPATKTASWSRNDFFEEIWRVCTRHGGEVSANYVSMWVRLCLEPRYPFLRPFHDLVVRAIRSWPGMKASLRATGRSWWDSMWVRRRTLLRRIAVDLNTRLAWMLHSVPGGARLVRKNVLGLRVGYRSDNWLRPTCELYPHQGASPQLLRLVGQAPVAMQLVVRNGDRLLGTFDLPGNAPTDVSIPIAEPMSKQPVILQFSRQTPTLMNPEPVSFRVFGTNLISEREVA